MTKHPKFKYGDPPPPYRSPKVQAKLDEGVRLVAEGMTIQEAAKKVGLSPSTLGPENFRVTGRKRNSIRRPKERTEAEKEMFDKIIEQMKEGIPLTFLAKEYPVSKHLMSAEWKRRGLPPRIHRSKYSNPQYSPVTLAMFKFLRDGEWHPQLETYEAGFAHVRPEFAIRWLEKRRREINRNNPNTRNAQRLRNLDRDQQVLFGRHGYVQTLANGNAFMERRREGDNIYYRLRVDDLPGVIRKWVFDDQDESQQKEA